MTDAEREIYCKDCDRSIYGEYHDCDVNIENDGKYVGADSKCYCKIVNGKRAEKYSWETEIVCFELNNWFSGRDYPLIDFVEELIDGKLSDDGWCRENRLCVLFGNYDMSLNWCVTAPKEWVEKNLPQLLSDDTYNYDVCSYSSDGEKKTTYTKKYSDFVRVSDCDGKVHGQFGWDFLEYCEKNFGITYCNDYGEITSY